MAKLMYRIGQWASAHAWRVLVAWILLLTLAAGAFFAFSRGLSTAVSIPGTPTHAVTDKLKTAIPDAAGGNAAVVFTANKALDAQQQQAISELLSQVSKQQTVQRVVDPFVTVQTQQQAQQQLAAKEQELAAGKAQYAAGKQTLADNQAKLDAGKAQLAQAQQAYERQAAQLSQAGLDPNQKPELLAVKAQLEQSAAQLAASEKQLAAGAEQLAQTEQRLADARGQLDAGKKLLDFASGAGQVSADGTTALATVVFERSLIQIDPEIRKGIVQLLSDGVPDGVSVLFSNDLVLAVPEILGVGEVVGAGVAFIVLLVLLRAFLPALLPLSTALVAVAVAVLSALSLSGIVDMMSITPVLGVMLGLAVGIDYTLFIVNRHRQGLLRGLEMRHSIALANGTSGSAVVFAGLTVIIALLGLNVTGVPFLATMGNVAAFAVAVAVVVAVTLTPALLGLLRTRVLARSNRAAVTSGQQPDSARGSAVRQMRTPVAWISVFVSVAVIVLLALPALHMRLGMPTGISEDPHSSQYRAYTKIAEKFGEGANSPLLVVAEPKQVAADQGALVQQQAQLAGEFMAQDGVSAVVPLAASADNKMLAFQVIPKHDSNSVETVALVDKLRALDSEQVGAQIGVAGNASAVIDVVDVLARALPGYLTLVVGLSLLVLVLVFRSVLVPLIATAGYILSLFAAFGAITAIYQDGFLRQLFAVHHPQPIIAFLPTIVMGILFGLAMDYQLFIASGIREAYVEGNSPRAAVRLGVAQGRAVVIAAALIMISVFGGFVFSHTLMIRPIGFGLAFGVLIDAFLVRLLLIPALMHILGKSAWWLPKWLDRLLPDLDIEGAKLTHK